MRKITISGFIGVDVTAATIRAQLTAARGDDISIDISSEGGLVFPSIDIFNAFRDYRRNNPQAYMASNIKSLAASGASYIAVNPVFNKVSVEDNAALMIHNSQGAVGGDRNEMKKYIDVLDEIDRILSAAYIERSGKSEAEIRAMMDAETWLFGQEVVTAGFAHEVIDTGQSVDRVAALASARTRVNSIQKHVKMDFAACVSGFSKDKIDSYISPSGKISSDGIIRSDADIEAAITGPQISKGTRSVDGIIRSDADIESAVRR